ncbi:MAG: hypothetical protein NZM37_06380, partial [Sandaracinaceae bacterium]|nr:hypothetical protein [Sandaracinaceae bacterium]
MSDGIWLVNNPRAGAGKAHLVARHVLRVLREIGEDPVWIQTEGEGDATKMVRKALEAGARGIVVVGGDGTLGEAASGFFDGKNSKHNGTFFVPITAGTGGDFRRNLGTPNFVHLSQSEITNWVKRIWFTSPRAIDVGWIRFTMSDGKISERIFLNIASFGISGLVDALVNASPKWMGGRAAFLIGTARALFQYKPQPVKITLDGGKVIEQEVMVVAVANGRCFGGGMCIAPKAQLDDGLLELTIVRQLSKP